MGSIFPPGVFRKYLALSPTDRLLRAQGTRDVDHFLTIERLVDADVDFIVSDSAAAALNGLPIPAPQFSVYVAPTRDNYDRLTGAFEEMRLDAMERDPEIPEPAFAAHLFVPEPLTYRELRETAVITPVGDHDILVPTVDDLLRLTRARIEEVEADDRSHDPALTTRDSRRLRYDLEDFVDVLEQLARHTGPQVSPDFGL